MNKILNFKGEYKGLDSQTAQDNLMFYGYNSEVRRNPEKEEKQPKFKFYGVFKSLRLYVMLAAAAAYMLESQAVPGSFVKGMWLFFLTIGLCVFEIIAENACDKKQRDITETSGVIVRAVRDGKIVLVPREHLVQDDLIILQGGENVPADAHILESTNVSADESIFTETNEPVTKHAGADKSQDLKQSCIYKGTKVLSGILIARVFAIGQDVKMRPKTVSAKEAGQTRFERFIGRQAVKLTYAAAIITVVIFVIKLITIGDVPKSDKDITLLSLVATNVLVPSVSFMLCAIPVSLTLIVRLYYIMGTGRMMEKYGEFKSLRAVETLNSVTSVCLSQESIVISDRTPIIEEYAGNKNMLSRIAALSCRVIMPAESNSYEKAISVSAAFRHIDIAELQENNTLLKCYSSDDIEEYNKMNGNLWDINGTALMCVKGAPEVVLSYCNLPHDKLHTVQKQYSEAAKLGHHVVAVAFAKIEPDDGYEYEEDSYDEDNPPVTIPQTLFEAEYTFIGLIAFSTEIKENVPVAVESYRKAGIKVIMMTADDRPGSKKAAVSIANRVGISERNVLAGDKVDIIKALQKNGETVAAFGTDSSDTRALELADVGIALSKHTTRREWDSGMDTLSQGTTGSACEACDLIMEETGAEVGIERSGLVKAAGAFRAARQMHRNIKRCISVALSSFVVTFLFAIINLFAGGGIVLEAALISTLSVIIMPLITLFFIQNETDLKSVQRSSLFISDGRINNRFILTSAIQGASLLISILVMFLIFRLTNDGYTTEMLRSVFLTVFTSGNIAMSWVLMSHEKSFFTAIRYAFASDKPIGTRRTNPSILITGLLAFVPLMVYLPYFNSVFGLKAINPFMFLLSMIIGIVGQLWFEYLKDKLINEKGSKHGR